MLMTFFFSAAVCRKFPDNDEKQIRDRMGFFLAGASDRDGSRQNRITNKQDVLERNENLCQNAREERNNNNVGQ